MANALSPLVMTVDEAWTITVAHWFLALWMARALGARSQSHESESASISAIMRPPPRFP
jgi:hypothetical protein